MFLCYVYVLVKWATKIYDQLDHTVPQAPPFINPSHMHHVGLCASVESPMVPISTLLPRVSSSPLATWRELDWSGIKESQKLKKH